MCEVSTLYIEVRLEMHVDIQANQRVIDLEEKHDLLRFKVDGWCVWPLFRHAVGEHFRGLKVMYAKQRMDYWIAPIVRDILTLFSLKKEKWMFMVYDSNLSEKRKDVYVDVFFDDLISETDRWFKIELLTNPIFLTARKNARFKANMTAISFVIASKLLSRSHCPSEVDQVAEDIYSILFRYEELRSFSRERTLRNILDFYWKKKLYEWFLKRTRPDILFMVTSYCNHAIIAAAKSMGVKVIEFQHGLITPWHSGYSWSKYANDYRESMPLPDKIFLYGEYWQRNLLINGFWKVEELPVVGSLRMDYHRRRNTSRPQDVTRLLFTSQGTDIENVLSFIVCFLQESRRKLSNIELYVKMHPGESDKKIYKKQLGLFPNVKIIASAEEPSTFDILSVSHLHLSISSTCHYEALALGVPTIILPFSSHESVLSLTQTGYAYLVRTPEELVQVVAEAKDLTVPNHVGGAFFAEDALSNMKRELAL